MRIGSQSVDNASIQRNSQNTPTKQATSEMTESSQSQAGVKNVVKAAGNKQTSDLKHEGISKEIIEEAVKSVNEFLHIEHKSSKFVLHDGLDKYFVRLVDADTEEVIKEIPPERLLDAFYEMQKLAGMIVDEKI